MTLSLRSIPFTVGALVALAFSLLPAPAAHAKGPALAPHSTVAGKTIGEWTQDWWSWALQEAEPNGPLTDTTGANANRNQSGPVFFLGGTTSAGADRTFTVPTDKYLLLPLINVLGTDSDVPGGTPDDLKTLVQGFVDQTSSLFASVDGVSLSQSDLFLGREDSGIFALDVAPGSVFDFPGGVPSGHHPFAYSDGYWLMLSPLSQGSHDIEFGGTLSSFGLAVDVHDHITAVPEPGAFALLLGSGSIGVSLLLRRRRK